MQQETAEKAEKERTSQLSEKIASLKKRISSGRLRVAKMNSRQNHKHVRQQSVTFKAHEKTNEVGQFFMQNPPDKCRNTEIKAKMAQILV